MDYVFDNKYCWHGWYLLTNGMLMHCDEYLGCSYWEEEWDRCTPLPDGAVYYEIYDGDEEVDGGVMGYMNGEPFTNFEEYIKADDPDYVIVERVVEEPDWY